jgi:hypothetical protein
MLVIRHICDQGTARLPKTADYWKKVGTISLFFLVSYTVARPTLHASAKYMFFAFGKFLNYFPLKLKVNRFCGLVVRVRFPALPDFFLRSSGSETVTTQPRDDN